MVMLVLIRLGEEIQRWFIDRNLNDQTNKMIENENEIIIFKLNIESINCFALESTSLKDRSKWEN
jgi:hypothetical protein